MSHRTAPEESHDASAVRSAAPDSRATPAVPALAEAKLREGVALLADLKLDVALQLIGSPPQRPAGTPICTAYVQEIIDALCAMSMEDGLTGLWNRRYFDHRFNQELLRARREGRCCAIALVDVDHFKRVNDVYGHAAGDHVLQALSKLMQDLLRMTDDVTSRFGGEEFAIILPGTDAAGAHLALDRLRIQVENHPFQAEGHRIHVTISAGVAAYDASWAETSGEELLKGADAALYEAKEGGRNRVCVHGQIGDDATTAVTRAERDLLLR